MAYDDNEDYSYGEERNRSEKRKNKVLLLDYDEPDERKMIDTDTTGRRDYSQKERNMIEEWLKNNKVQSTD